MDVTRRFWGVAGFITLFVSTAVLFDRPLLFLGAVGLGAWLVGAQVAFSRAALRAVRTVNVEQTITPQSGTTNTEFEVDLSVTTDEPTPLPVVCTLQPPPSVIVSTSRDCLLDRGEVESSSTVAFRAAVAGTLEFGRPALSLRDPYGLFTETVRTGSTDVLNVSVVRPGNLHIGRGGTEVTSVFSDIESGQVGDGIVPSRLREYQPGDSARRIDWLATARTGTVIVIEEERDANRQLAVVFDTRATMNTGEPGRTKLDYAREVALSVVDVAERMSDPVGLYAFGDGGLLEETEPGASQSSYDQVRDSLRGFTGTTDRVDRPAAPRSDLSPTNPPRTTEVNRIDRLLANDRSQLARAVRPFLAARDTYVRRVRGDPLFAALRVVNERLESEHHVVIVTDDSHPTELYETVRFASQDSLVTVFILPTVLFETAVEAGGQASYERYRSFESLRSDLDAMPDVSAYEVGPGERLEEILQRARSTAGPT